MGEGSNFLWGVQFQMQSLLCPHNNQQLVVSKVQIKLQSIRIGKQHFETMQMRKENYSISSPRSTSAAACWKVKNKVMFGKSGNHTKKTTATIYYHLICAALY